MDKEKVVSGIRTTGGVAAKFLRGCKNIVVGGVRWTQEQMAVSIEQKVADSLARLDGLEKEAAAAFDTEDLNKLAALRTELTALRNTCRTSTIRAFVKSRSQVEKVAALEEPVKRAARAYNTLLSDWTEARSLLASAQASVDAALTRINDVAAKVLPPDDCPVVNQNTIGDLVEQISQIDELLQCDQWRSAQSLVGQWRIDCGNVPGLCTSARDAHDALLREYQELSAHAAARMGNPRVQQEKAIVEEIAAVMKTKPVKISRLRQLVAEADELARRG